MAATCPEWMRDDLIERVRPFCIFWSLTSESLVIENSGILQISQQVVVFSVKGSPRTYV